MLLSCFSITQELNVLLQIYKTTKVDNLCETFKWLSLLKMRFVIMTMDVKRMLLLLVFCCLESYYHLSFLSQAFSVFFVCVAFTSDIICLLFIPVQWLFFAASTYVWVQYVWHTGEYSPSFWLDVQIFTANQIFCLRLSFLLNCKKWGRTLSVNLWDALLRLSVFFFGLVSH